MRLLLIKKGICFGKRGARLIDINILGARQRSDFSAGVFLLC